jgi:PAS domain S-box-containing protein
MLMAAVTAWSLSYGLELANVDPTYEFLWARLRYLGVVSVPVIWLLFALQYVGREDWLTPRNIVLLSIVPLLTLLLVWTNNHHHAIWRTRTLVSEDGFSFFSYEYGPALWVHAAYAYALLLVAGHLLFAAFLRAFSIYRGQAALLFLAGLAPCLGNLAYLAGLSRLDPTPLCFGLIGVMLLWGLLRSRMLDIQPLAWEAIIEHVGDGVLVVDVRGRIVALTPAVGRLIDQPKDQLVGKPAAKFLSPWIDLDQYAPQGSFTQTGISIGDAYYDLQISPLRDQGGHLAGRVIALHEVTARKRVEDTLRARETFLRTLNQITCAALEMTELESMLEMFADRMDELIDVDGCCLTLWDARRRVALPAAACGEVGATYASIQVEPGKTTLTESILQAGRPLVVEDVSDSPYVTSRAASSLPHRSVLALPLIAGTQKLGALLLSFAEMHHFTTEEIARGEQTAAQIALAVAKIRQLEETRARWQGAETLRQAIAVVTETLSLEETLERILDWLGQVVPYDSASVQLLREGTLEIVGGQGFAEADPVEGMRFPIPGDNPNTQVIESQEPLVLEDVRGIYHEFRDSPHDHIRSWMGVPLIVRDEVIGMLSIDRVKIDAFNDEDIEAVIPFANQVAVAIENARLFEQTEHLKEFNESIVEGVAEAILITDADGRFTFVNRAAEELLGYTRHELVGRSWRDVVPQEEVERIRRGSVSWKEWRSKPREGVLLSKGGQRIPVIISSRPVFDGGAFDGVLAACTDITDRKQVEEALHRRNRELAMLNRAGRVLSSTLDLDEVLVTLLEEVRRLMNIAASSIWLVDNAAGEVVCRQVTGPQSGMVHGWRLQMGKGIVGWVVERGKGLVVPDTRADARHFGGVDDETGLETRSALCVPLRVKDRVVGALEVVDTEAGRFSEADLDLMDALAASAAIAIENARLYELAQQEIDERRRVEVALRESEERYRTLMENLPLGVYRNTPGPRGEFLMANPAFLDTFGFDSLEQLQQVAVADVYAVPEERQRFSDNLLDSGSVTGVEIRLRRRDGSPIWGAVTASVVYDPETGEPAYFDCTIEDITERKQVEQEREKLIEELDAFDYTVAHDLKSPLNLVVGYAETLEEEYSELSEEEVRDILRRIARGGRKATKIIDALLLLAMIRKWGDVEMMPLDMGDIVAESLERLQHEIEERGAVLEQPDRWPMALGYGPWIEEVWVNYLSNAVRYGGRSPQIDLGADVEPSGQIRFWVRDQGPGISAEDQERLFARSTELRPSTNGGHGFGLSIVQRIVEKFGGRVGVESKVGEGSTFYFTLPAADEA